MSDIETAKRLFYDAVALLDAGDYRAGASRLREALAFAPDSISILTNLAGALMLQGSLAESREVAQRILTLDGRNPGAHLVIAECLAKEGRYVELVPTLETVIALEPQVAEHHDNLSVALNRLGRHAEALANSEAAIALKPGLAAAHVNRGNSLADLKRSAEAVAAYERAVALDPRLAEAWLGSGNALAALKRQDDALAAYDRALALNSTLAHAWLGRGNLFAAARRYEEALAAFDQALTLAPDLAEAWLGRGNLYAAASRSEDALAAFDKALGLAPDLVEAWLGCGNVHARCQHRDEAFAAYDKALALDPGAGQAWVCRGNLLAALQRYDEAAAAYDHAVEVAPDLAAAWLGRGTVFALRKRFEDAVAAYDKALAIDPDLEYAPGCRFVARTRLCDWSRYEAERTSILSAVRRGACVAAPFDLIGVATSAADQLACARSHVAAKCPPASPLPLRPRDRRDKIKIAYLSADYGYHPVSLLLAGLFEQHDRSRFHTTAISFGPDEDNAMRRRIKGAFDRFVDADRISDAAVAELLRQHGTDIAIDLMGFTSGCRPGIFAMRAAPLQVNYLGFPATMGAGYIDYIIADSYVVSATSEPYYAERIVRLPDTFQANDGRRPRPARIPSRREVGLPEDAFVFCSFNNLAKITPEIFDVWMRLLHETSDGVMWLLGEGAVTERNLRREAAARGVAPERLVFMPRVPYAEYLARYRAADLFVDTFPFNGGTTVSDALWMGLPVVTLSGETFASRMAGSLLGAAGLPELATRSLADYARVALALAADRPRLAAIRAKLVTDCATLPLFDTGRFCRHIEAAYAAMDERHLRGEPPASFAIGPTETA